METITKAEETTQENKFAPLLRLIPLVLLIFNITFFFYILSDSTAEEFKFLFAIVGGGITVILSFITVAVLVPVLFDKVPILAGLLCVSTLFIFGYFFILRTVNYHSKELRANGVLTQAEIVDKTKIYGRRGKTIQSMSVRFKTKKDKQYTVKIELTKDEYNNFKKGMSIPIYYSSKNPMLASIAYRELRKNE